MKETSIIVQMQKEPTMMSVSQISEVLEHILEVEARQLAKEAGFIQRERAFTGADFAQMMIFGFLAEPHLSLCGLSQVAQRREVSISAPGLSQRFTQQAALFLQQVLQRLTAVRLQKEALDLPLLSRFAAVIVEDSTTIRLPQALHAIWPDGATEQAALKLFVQLDLCSGALIGPVLTQGKHADACSPCDLDTLPDGALYLADLGFFSVKRLLELSDHRRGKKHFFVTRWKKGTRLWTRSGHQLVLEGLLPQQVGPIRELGVLVGHRRRRALRLIMQRVPPDVAQQRREKLRADARDHGRQVGEDTLALADWSIVLTNVPRARLKQQEVLVLLAARWQIERLFWLWKQEAGIDQWNSHQPWRILCECYAKLAGVLIQQWLLQAGCWHEPERSLVKAAQVVRRECGRLMVALWEGQVETTLRSILRCMSSKGCRLEKRRRFPSTAHCLQSGRLPTQRRIGPAKSRFRKLRSWPRGKGWGCSGRPSRRKMPAVLLT
jgi:DDE family transposase